MCVRSYSSTDMMGKLDMDVVLKVLEVVLEEREASLLDVAHAVKSFDTAHRYVEKLAKIGLIKREKRGRRLILSLTDDGLKVYTHLKMAKVMLDVTPELPASPLLSGKIG